MPPVLTVSAGYGVVNNLGDFRLTQPAMDNELPGAPFQPGDFAEDRNDFVMSTAFGRAVGVARALAGMPTYQANVTGIEARADKEAVADWPADARYRLTTSDSRTLYAASLDVATGLGPPKIPQAAGDQLAGRTFVDPATGYQAVFDPVVTYGSSTRGARRSPDSCPRTPAGCSVCRTSTACRSGCTSRSCSTRRADRPNAV